jgi:hypothetical protein
VQKSLIVTAVALGAVALAGGALAADGGEWIGAIRSHRSVEQFDLAVGVTASQQPRRALRYDENREVYVVPSHYGDLFALTSANDTVGSTVLWFRDDTGAIRNAVVPNTATNAYKIVKGTTSRYEVDLREK